ncbi:MAG: RluA family pseudouridine synthase [Spirochaetota bacterium]
MKKREPKITSVEKECIVGLEGIGERLDRYLGSRFTYHSRTEWQRIIEQGIVRVNGVLIQGKARLKKGDRIVYQIHGLVEPEVNDDVRVLYDDGDLIICDKSGDLPVIPSGKYYQNTLYAVMTKRFGTIRLINRTDRETSGIVLLSRTDACAAAIHTIIGTSAMKKLYIAVVSGTPPRSFTVRGNIGHVPHADYRQMQGFAAFGKFSHTDFFRVSSANGYAMLFCRIFTGRTHQIRVHLREKGFHIVGDKIYGKEGPSIFQEFLKSGNDISSVHSGGMFRQALHAYKVSFTHPLTGRRVSVKAPLPKDIEDFARDQGLMR